MEVFHTEQFQNNALETGNGDISYVTRVILNMFMTEKIIKTVEHPLLATGNDSS